MKRKHTLTLLAPLVLFSSSHAASVLTGGHADAPGFGYDGGFEPHIHVGAGSIIDGVAISSDAEFEPDELIVAIPETSTVTVGSTTYYWLPEGHDDAEDAGAAHIGIGLEELDSADWVGSTVTISLLSFSGPGDFLLWQDDGFGGQIIFLDTANNITSFDRSLLSQSHSHFNWGFTEKGLFEIEFGISGTHVDDGFQSASGTYLFMVPEPSAALLGAFGALGLLRRRR